MEDDLPPPYRHPLWIDENREPLEMLFDAEGFPVILFEPVPLLRRRRKGWDENRQRAFIAMLARVPSPTRAAKMVGMSARSAYALLDKPGAESFAKAWDMAIDHGMWNLRGTSIARSLEGGDYVPVFRKGRLVRVDYRPNDRLAIALLSGRAGDNHDLRRASQSRWRRKQEWSAQDAERAAIAAEREAQRQAYVKDCEDFIARNAKPREPRIRTL